MVSFSDYAEGDSVPINTPQKFALTIQFSSAGRDARSIEVSVKNPNGYFFSSLNTLLMLTEAICPLVRVMSRALSLAGFQVTISGGFG